MHLPEEASTASVETASLEVTNVTPTALTVVSDAGLFVVIAL